jgi:hypothetical protein
LPNLLVPHIFFVLLAPRGYKILISPEKRVFQQNRLHPALDVDFSKLPLSAGGRRNIRVAAVGRSRLIADLPDQVGDRLITTLAV